MFPEATKVNLQQEAKTMAAYLEQGNPCASIYLARLIEADTLGALRPFAEALAARLSDHLNRYAELGITDPDVTLQDEVYQLIQTAAMDWAGDSGNDQPCEATGIASNGSETIEMAEQTIMPTHAAMEGSVAQIHSSFTPMFLVDLQAKVFCQDGCLDFRISRIPQYYRGGSRRLLPFLPMLA